MIWVGSFRSLQFALRDVELRAERSGNGTGRIYTVTVRCKDARGNSATQNTSVTVAHDQGH
jgi:hypothetical protein